MNNVKAVFAVDKKGNFGTSDNKLPWGKPIRADMEFFIENTVNQVVVMGKNTWESLPSKLVNRINVVISDSQTSCIKFAKSGYVLLPDMVVSGSPEEMLLSIKEKYPDKQICVIGGKNVLTQLLPYCDSMSYTVIDKDCGDCDIKFNAYKFMNVVESSVKEAYDESSETNLKFVTSIIKKG